MKKLLYLLVIVASSSCVTVEDPKVEMEMPEKVEEALVKKIDSIKVPKVNPDSVRATFERTFKRKD